MTKDVVCHKGKCNYKDEDKTPDVCNSSDPADQIECDAELQRMGKKKRM